MWRFETVFLATGDNLAALAELSGQWIDRVHAGHPPKAIVLDMDSSVSPTHGDREGTAEQHIKEGKNAIRWTRLSCQKFHNNAVRLQLHTLAYNLANFMRPLALPKEVERWSLTTLREKLVKIGAKVVRHGRYVTFQLAEVAVSRELFRKILSLIDDLRPRPAPA